MLGRTKSQKVSDLKRDRRSAHVPLIFSCLIAHIATVNACVGNGKRIHGKRACNEARRNAGSLSESRIQHCLVATAKIIGACHDN